MSSKLHIIYTKWLQILWVMMLIWENKGKF